MAAVSSKFAQTAILKLLPPSISLVAPLIVFDRYLSRGQQTLMATVHRNTADLAKKQLGKA